MITTIPTSAAIHPIEVDAEQMELFIRTMFRHAEPGGIVSIRAFPQGGEGESRALFVRSFEVTENLKELVRGAINNAIEAAKCGAVFSPPVCTFKKLYSATESNLAEGLAISIECDEDAQQALETMREILGPPTLVVASGGRWLDRDTGETQDKLHLHWRLMVPARDVEAQKKLKFARKLGTTIAGADPSNVPIVHPIRWAGSLHMKAEPRLCRIIEANVDSEIDLDTAFDDLKAAAPVEVAAPTYADDAEKASRKSSNPWLEFAADVRSGGGKSDRMDIATLAELMPYVPNPDLQYNDWNSIGLALWRATSGSDDGLALFNQFSERSLAKHDAQATARRWRAYRHSPPTRTGGNKLAEIARQNGWKTKSTHPAINSSSLDEARKTTRRHVLSFLYPNPYTLFGDEFIPTVTAARIGTGIGKTTTVIEEISKFDVDMFHAMARDADKTLKRADLFHYAVPTLKLADEVAGKFGSAGVNVRVARGRGANDPNSPGALMCLAYDKVEIAVEAKAPVTEACCKSGDDECPFYQECGYQKQWRCTEGLKGWVFPFEFLFHRNEALGVPDFIVLDESFWNKQIRGIESGHIELWLSFSGKALGKILDAQPRDGPLLYQYARHADYLVKNKPRAGKRSGDSKKVPRDQISFLDDLIRQQWDSMPDVPYSPSIDARELKALFKEYGREMKQIAYVHVCVRVLEEIRDMIDNEIQVSGRLNIAHDKSDARVITWRGVETIKEQFKRRTLLLDATLPPLEILRVAHPQVKVVSDINVDYDPAMVHVCQFTEAPVSKKKLAMPTHAESLRRLILRRWMETGRGTALVITNIDFEKALASTLPEEIALAHFNAVAGLDSYGDVRLLMVIGRPMPKSYAVEANAGALSGRWPDCLDGDGDEGDEHFTWYPTVMRGIRMRDGTGVAVRGYEHPDRLCEAIRYQICEGELMQAIGRARGVNRDASRQLNIDLVHDCALPLTIDSHEIWDAPSLHYRCAVDGAILESPTDLLRCWPNVFKNLRAAERAVSDGVPALSGFERVRYQLKAKNQRWRFAWFDRSMIPEPPVWIEERLGPAKVEAI